MNKLIESALPLKITRLYSGKNGKSHFEDLPSLPLVKEYAGMPTNKITDSILVKEVFFHTYTTQFFWDWHNPHNRFGVLYLEGEQEIEAGDGTRRLFSRGDLLIMEDSTGPGHKTRGVKAGYSLILVLEKNATF